MKAFRSSLLHSFQHAFHMPSALKQEAFSILCCIFLDFSLRFSLGPEDVPLWVLCLPLWKTSLSFHHLFAFCSLSVLSANFGLCNSATRDLKRRKEQQVCYVDLWFLDLGY